MIGNAAYHVVCFGDGDDDASVRRQVLMPDVVKFVFQVLERQIPTEPLGVFANELAELIQVIGSINQLNHSVCAFLSLFGLFGFVVRFRSAYELVDGDECKAAFRKLGKCGLQGRDGGFLVAAAVVHANDVTGFC